MEPRIRHIFVSPGHNFRGHHGKLPGEHPINDVDEAACVAGSGLTGDRYFDHQSDFKGQITFFAWDVFESLCSRLDIHDKSPSVLRRNVFVEGLDLNALIGKEFSLQGIAFHGAEQCSPCHWMNQAFGPGAEEALQGRGGLRARILTSGTLRRDPP